jgi:hypothetical protein
LLVPLFISFLALPILFFFCLLLLFVSVLIPLSIFFQVLPSLSFTFLLLLFSIFLLPLSSSSPLPLLSFSLPLLSIFVQLLI